MHRSRLRIVVGLSLGAALVVSCGEGPQGEPSAALPEVPTQEQADAEAREAISEQNADAVLDELSREVEADLAGDG